MKSIRENCVRKCITVCHTVSTKKVETHLNFLPVGNIKATEIGKVLKTR